MALRRGKWVRPGSLSGVLMYGQFSASTIPGPFGLIAVPVAIDIIWELESSLIALGNLGSFNGPELDHS